MTARSSTSPEETLWAAMSNGDPQAARDLVHGLMRQGVAGTAVIRDVLAPAQRASGLHWQSAQWTVADEHLGTAVVEAALATVEAGCPPVRQAEAWLVVACAESEWHTTPARMAAQVLRERGSLVRFLGPSTPADHLREYLGRLQPDALILSATMPTSLPGAARSIEAAHDVGVPVVAGGAAFGIDPSLALCLGADAWLPHPSAFDAAPTRARTSGVPTRLDWPTFLAFQDAAPAAAEDAYLGLLVRVPHLQGMTARQQARTREDLRHILDFLAVTLLTGDQRVIGEFTVWLGSVLTSRGVPKSALAASYRALAAELEPMNGAVLTALADQAAA